MTLTLQRLWEDHWLLGLATLQEANARLADVPNHTAIDRLLGRAIRQGGDELEALTREAVRRWLRSPHQPHLFSSTEKDRLAELLVSVRATSDLLGRALVRRAQQRAENLTESLREDLSKIPNGMTPEAAVAYFRGLVPTLGTDPHRFGEGMRRQAFTLAAATEQQLLTKVQAALARGLATGEDSEAQVEKLLDAAGVGRGAGYSETVFRTNVMDALNTGYDEERRSPDVVATFPIWQYSNPDDVRSRPEHAARDGNYYPADVPFALVRGIDDEDVFNCRCTPIAIDKWSWAELKAAGAVVADGYEDPTEA